MSTLKQEIDNPNLEEDNNNAVELSLQRYSIFCLQNFEDGFFDVIFEFKDAKKLYAHSFILWSASETFKAMLLGPLATKDQILITTYSYENFKEFLTFLYLGKCAIKIENVMAIVDLAESYNVQLLKDKCDTFLTNIEITDANLYTVYENLKMYSLKAALENLFDYISFNVETILSSFGFVSAKKEFILDIVKLETLSTTEENLFNSILKWIKCQFSKQDIKNDEKEWIKKELTDILPHIRFPVMNVKFLHEVVVPNGFLFSSFEELSFILRDADSYPRLENEKFALKFSHYNSKIRKYSNRVIFTDQSKNRAISYILDKAILDAIKKFSQNVSSSNRTNIMCQIINYNSECFWQCDIPRPNSNGKIWLKDNKKFYAVRNAQGKFGIKQFNSTVINQGVFHNPNNAESYDIIAELNFEKESFIISQGCLFKVD